MHESKREETISALWAICAILSFGFGFETWGWVFAIKAALDTACAIFIAITEIRKESEHGK